MDLIVLIASFALLFLISDNKRLIKAHSYSEDELSHIWIPLLLCILCVGLFFTLGKMPGLLIAAVAYVVWALYILFVVIKRRS